MASVMIGGEARTVSLPNFVKIEAAWSFLDKAMGEPNPMVSVRAMLGVVAVGMQSDDAEPEALTPEVLAPKVAELAKALKSTEIRGIRNLINPLLVEIGLAQADDGDGAGEAAPAEETASPSTAISETSSSPSSPSSDQPTGTA